MTRPSRAARRGRRLAAGLTVAATGALGLAAGAPAAQAAPFTCAASPLSLSSDLPGIGTATSTLTDGLGVPEGACGRNGAVPRLPDNPLLTGGVLSATTSLTNGSSAQRDQVATSSAGLVEDLRLAGLGTLGLPAPPTIPIPDVPTSLPLPLPTLPTIPGLPAIPTSLPVSLSAVLGDLQTQLQQQLADGTLLSVGAGQVSATARCVDGRVAGSGTASPAPVKLLGVDVPADGIAHSIVLDTSDLSLTRAQVAGPIDAALGQLSPALRTALRPYLGQLQDALIGQVLGALPDTGIPVDAIQATVSTPPAAVADGTRVTQDGTAVALRVGGQLVLRAAIGTASVGFGGVDCAPAAAAPPGTGQSPSTGTPPTTAQTAAQQLLQCSERRLVLTNVLQRSDRVALFGVADKAFAGQTVQIRFRATKQDVARAVVQPDGTFEATAPLPSRKLRATNDARYEARIGANRSLDLKLQRRMTVASLSQSDGMVTVKGRLVDPLPVGGATVLISRRVSCTKLEPLKRVKAAADGTYSVTVPAPAGESAVVYRLQSKVRNNRRNRKTFPTFTLPQGIDIAK